jgi:hypothetical protein
VPAAPAPGDGPRGRALRGEVAGASGHGRRLGHTLCASGVPVPIRLGASQPVPNRVAHASAPPDAAMATPAARPVEPPTPFALGIPLTIAKALGLTIPPTRLVQAAKGMRCAGAPGGLTPARRRCTGPRSSPSWREWLPCDPCDRLRQMGGNRGENNAGFALVGYELHPLPVRSAWMEVCFSTGPSAGYPVLRRPARPAVLMR